MRTQRFTRYGRQSDEGSSWTSGVKDKWQPAQGITPLGKPYDTKKRQRQDDEGTGLSKREKTKYQKAIPGTMRYQRNRRDTMSVGSPTSESDPEPDKVIPRILPQTIEQEQTTKGKGKTKGKKSLDFGRSTPRKNQPHHPYRPPLRQAKSPEMQTIQQLAPQTKGKRPLVAPAWKGVNFKKGKGQTEGHPQRARDKGYTSNPSPDNQR